MPVVGIGVDITDIARFAATIEKTPQLLDTFFTPVEQRRPRGTALPVASLAARFAAKEAVAKALGSPGGMRWQDCLILAHPSGQPYIEVHGSVAQVAAERGITTWQLSLSHDGGMAVAFVTASGPASGTSADASGPRGG